MDRRKIIITDHARKRLHERVKDQHNDAYRRMVKYAWKNGKTLEILERKDPAAASLITRNVYCGRSRLFKLYGDHVYIFAYSKKGERVLVTVMSVEEMVKRMKADGYRFLEIVQLKWGVHMVVYQDVTTGVNSVRFLRDAVVKDGKLTAASKEKFFAEKDLNYEESEKCVTVSFFLEDETEKLLQEFCDMHKITQYALMVAVSKFLCNPDNHDCIIATIEKLTQEIYTEEAV